MSLVTLKIKVKHLSEEARIIRHEELKRRGVNWGHTSAVLRDHRTGVLRREARDSFVAYGYLKGTPYNLVEAPAEDNPPNWTNVKNIVKRFSDTGFNETDFAAWVSAGLNNLVESRQAA